MVQARIRPQALELIAGAGAAAKGVTVVVASVFVFAVCSAGSPNCCTI